MVLATLSVRWEHWRERGHLHRVNWLLSVNRTSLTAQVTLRHVISIRMHKFSAMGALEGAWSLAQGKLATLSEQNIIDCSGDLETYNIPPVKFVSVGMYI